jgi:hypothetical protein
MKASASNQQLIRLTTAMYTDSIWNMTALNHDARIAGKAAMESGLSPMARARRRFKAGRPTKITNVLVTPAEAVRRATVEFAKLQDLTREEMQLAGKTLDPTDIRAGLVYVTPDERGHTEWLSPWQDELTALWQKINALSGCVFLGVVFHQFDRDAEKPEAKHTFWVLQFVAGTLAEKHLFEERDKARLTAELM